MDWLIKAARRPIGVGIELGQICNRKGCEGILENKPKDVAWSGYFPYMGAGPLIMIPVCPECGHKIEE